MVVGICRVVLALPWNDSLKGKRSVVKRILERARVRFNVAAAEVAVGLAIVVMVYRNTRSVDINALNRLRG